MVGLLCRVQFHPEHMAGPADTEWLFDVFLEAVQQHLVQGHCHAALSAMFTAKCQAPAAPCPVLAFKPRKALILGSGGLTIGKYGAHVLKTDGRHAVIVNHPHYRPSWRV